MACFQWASPALKEQTSRMACFDRASPALKEILLKLHRAEKLMEIDHHLYEFGSVQYHIQVSTSEPHYIYLSVSTPLLSPGVPLSDGLPHYTLQAVKRIYSDVLDVVNPPKGGYQLTLRINFSKLPQSKEDCVKVITDISSLQAVILSSQLKEMLWSLGSQDTSHGMYKPIKLVYHPREPFFVIKLPEKITAVFPMRFRDDSDVIIATALFQELMDVGCSGAWAKAPACTWSPIPPPELRGEPFHELSTNGGFVSFDMLSRHVEGSKLDKTVWNLLNFYAYVKYHVKCTRGLIQRRMRKRLESLSEIIWDRNCNSRLQVLQKTRITADENNTKVKGRRRMGKLIRISKSIRVRRKGCPFTMKIKRIRSKIKIHGFARFRRRWLKVPKFSSLRRYTKLD